MHPDRRTDRSPQQIVTQRGMLVPVFLPDALKIDGCFCKENIETMGEGCYASGNPREGVVVRSMENHFGHKPISFKVINLSYNN